MLMKIVREPVLKDIAFISVNYSGRNHEIIYIYIYRKRERVWGKKREKERKRDRVGGRKREREKERERERRVNKIKQGMIFLVIMYEFALCEAEHILARIERM